MQNVKGQPVTKDITTQVQLFFWTEHEALADLLVQSLGTAPALPLDPASVSAALRNGKRPVILWRGPDFALIPCLTDAKSAASALDDWKDKARRLITLHRKNRQTMILLEAASLNLSGTAALTDRLGLDAVTDPWSAAAVPYNALAQALSRLAVEHDQDLRILVEDLVAASLPAKDTSIPEMLDLVVQEAAEARQTYGKLLDLLKASEAAGLQSNAALTDATARAEHLQDQISRMESSLNDQASAAANAAEEALQRQAALDAQVLRSEQKATALAAEGAAIGARLVEVTTENRSLQSQLALAQSSLADQTRQTDDGALQIAALVEQVARHTQNEAALSAETNALRAALADREAETESLDERVAALLAQLAAQDKKTASLVTEATAVSTRLLERDAEAKALTGQIAILQANLSEQTAKATVAALRIGDLETATAELETTFNDLMGESDAELKLLRDQIGFGIDAIAEQSGAAALQTSVLQDQLARMQTKSSALVAEAMAVSARLAERDAEAKALTGQVALLQSDLAAQEAHAQAAALRVGELEAAMADQEANFNALLGETLAEVNLLHGQLDLGQEVISEQSGAAAMQSMALEDQLAKLERKSAALLAEGMAVSARLAERETDVSLLRAQVAVAQSELQAQIDAKALAAADIAAERANAEQAMAEWALTDNQLSERTAELQRLRHDFAEAKMLQAARLTAAEDATRTIRGEVGKIEKALADEHARRVEAVAEKNRLTAELHNRAAEIDLVFGQVGILQDGIAQVYSATATEAKQAARNDDWDRALAKALATSRSEAERRVKAEQDLEALRSRLQGMVQREEDLAYNRKLFSQMTSDANAALDELARISAAAHRTAPPS